MKINNTYIVLLFSTAQKPTKFNKYNIWTNALQEESLMENLRGCDVNNKRKRGRNVEDYDYSLKYKLNDGETSNKLEKYINSYFIINLIILNIF